MCVYDYVYIFKTNSGKCGIVRADSYEEAFDRVTSSIDNWAGGDTGNGVSLIRLEDFEEDHDRDNGVIYLESVEFRKREE